MCPEFPGVPWSPFSPYTHTPPLTHTNTMEWGLTVPVIPVVPEVQGVLDPHLSQNHQTAPIINRDNTLFIDSCCCTTYSGAFGSSRSWMTHLPASTTWSCVSPISLVSLVPTGPLVSLLTIHTTRTVVSRCPLQLVALYELCAGLKNTYIWSIFSRCSIIARITSLALYTTVNLSHSTLYCRHCIYYLCLQWLQEHQEVQADQENQLLPKICNQTQHTFFYHTRRIVTHTRLYAHYVHTHSCSRWSRRASDTQPAL